MRVASAGSQGCPWVLSVASFHNSDVFASSGGDGVVRFWQLTKGSKEERRVLPIGNAPVVRPFACAARCGAALIQHLPPFWFAARAREFDRVWPERPCACMRGWAGKIIAVW